MIWVNLGKSKVTLDLGISCFHPANAMGVFVILSLCLPILIAVWLLRQDPKPINAIYSQPNKWYALKYCIFRLLLRHRKRHQHRSVNGENAGMGRKSRNSPEDMDKVQPLDLNAPKVVPTILQNSFILYQTTKF